MKWSFSRNTLLLIAGFSVHSFGYGFALPNYPLYVKLLGASSSDFGLLVFLKTISLAIFMLPGGWFTDKFGPKQAVLIMGVGDVGSWLILSVAPTWEWIGAYAILIGVAGGFGMGAWYVILANENADQEGIPQISVFAVGILSFMIPDALGSLSGIGYFKLFGDIYSLPILNTTFKLGLVCNIVAFGFYIFIRQPEHQITGAPKSGSFAEFFSKKHLPFMGILIAQFSIGIGGGMILDFFPLYFVDRFQVAPSINSLLRSLSSILMSITTLLTPIVANKLGSTKTVYLGQSLTIPAIIILAIEKNHFWIAAAAFLFREAIIHLVPPVTSSLMMGLLNEENRGKGGGLYELFWQGGYAISPPISGRWIQSYGFAPSFYVAALGYSLSTVIFYGAMRIHKPEQKRNLSSSKIQDPVK